MFEGGGIINELFIERLNYLIYVVLLLIGLHAMIAKNNLIKKLIGMSIFQTAIILFYVSVGVKEGATIPIYLPEHDPHGSHASHSDGNETEQSNHGPVVLDAELVKGYSNPLPHVLMLTAIVVGVATLGLALALCLRIYQGYGTIEEDEILAKIEKQEMRSNPSDVLKSADSSKQATSRSAKSVSKPKVSSPQVLSDPKQAPKLKQRQPLPQPRQKLPEPNLFRLSEKRQHPSRRPLDLKNLLRSQKRRHPNRLPKPSQSREQNQKQNRLLEQKPPPLQKKQRLRSLSPRRRRNDGKCNSLDFNFPVIRIGSLCNFGNGEQENLLSDSSSFHGGFALGRD